jgi:hypothetical protein
MSSNHTPTPWTQYQGGATIYGPDGYIGITQSKNKEADAAFIVLAANSYASSQAEIERLRKVIQSAAEEFVTIELRLRAMEVERALGAVMCGQRDCAAALSAIPS